MTGTATATPLLAPADGASGASGEGPATLEIESLSVAYQTRTGTVHAVRDVSLAVRAGQTLGIVGESGSGKSTLAFAVMDYLGEAGAVTGGSIRLHGEELTRLPPPALRRLRGARMAMVYQDPQTALNPGIPVGEQVAETRRAHSGDSREAAWRRSVETLGRVGLPDPERIAGRYPHQLSGGQQQRVVIAMALVNDPELLIMDEPTTGLDVTTEALVLDLVNELKRASNAAIVFISHNLGVIAQVCDRVAVMYAGEVVEVAEVDQLFRAPRHPYTVGLLGCLPRPGDTKDSGGLRPIPGRLQAPAGETQGCVFAPRCALARDACRHVPPVLYVAERAGEAPHAARCHFWDEVPAFQAAQAMVAGPLLKARSEAGREAALDHGGRADPRDPPPIIGELRSLMEALDDGGPAAAPSAVVPPSAVPPMARLPLLEVRGVSRCYGTRDFLARLLEPLTGRKRRVRAVERVSFDLQPGETVAIVGESGCGKTTLARTLAGLDAPTAGSIHFLGQDVTCTADNRPAALRRQLQMVFQNPDASLNPRQTVGQIVSRPVNLFLGLRGEMARCRVMELLLSVGLDPTYYERYPRQLSGGEKQRVSIARAFAGDPQLVICDEAVSALDVSVQATILNLLVRLQRERGTSYLFISHDLSVVQYLADRIAVMYLGQIVEMGPTADIMRGPQHPYTQALLSAIPVPDPAVRQGRIRLAGPVPSPTARPAGCPFAGRCPRYLGPVCDETPPPMQDAGGGHQIACHIPLTELGPVAAAPSAAPPGVAA